jgi:hypothetical protein
VLLLEIVYPNNLEIITQWESRRICFYFDRNTYPALRRETLHSFDPTFPLMVISG